jgi:hypothetical protein
MYENSNFAPPKKENQPQTKNQNHSQNMEADETTDNELEYENIHSGNHHHQGQTTNRDYPERIDADTSGSANGPENWGRTTPDLDDLSDFQKQKMLDDQFLKQQNSWNEIWDEKSKLEDSKSELQKWQEKLIEQGETIDKTYNKLLQNENDLIENMKIFEDQKNDLISRDLTHQKLSAEFSLKENDLDKKATDFESFWKELDRQRCEILELLSQVDNTLTITDKNPINPQEVITCIEEIRLMKSEVRKFIGN